MWEYYFYQTAEMNPNNNGIADLWQEGDPSALTHLSGYFKQGYEVQWVQILPTSHPLCRMVFLLRRQKSVA